MFERFKKNKNAAVAQQPGKQRLTLPQMSQTGGTLSIRDVSNSLWFPAGQPIHPVAPKGTPPRRYAYQPMTNINFTGRDGGVDFRTLRNFASYPICRLIIETVLDKLCGIKWEINLIAEEGETKKQVAERASGDMRIKEVQDFLKFPDGWQNFRTWLRGLADDMLVGDCATVWLCRDSDQKIASLIQIDGALVFPLVDETGQQPDAGRVLVQTSSKKADKDYLGKAKQPSGSPAFQLTPYGFPAQEMTADELIYAVRNRKTYTKYGLGIVEQALSIIALGMGRLDFQAAYYSSGNVPEFIAFMPPDVVISKVEEANEYLDSILKGNLGNRRKGFYLPSYGTDKAPNIIFPKVNEQVLKDEFDEWLARVMCFAFGISPTAFIKSMNRASAEQYAEMAEEEGLQPYIDWAEDLLNLIIQEKLGYYDLQIAPQTRKEMDAEKQAQINQINISYGMKTLNEIREFNGDDPIEEEWANVPVLITPTGGVVRWDGEPMSDLQQAALDQATANAKNAANPPEPKLPGSPANPPEPKLPGSPAGKPPAPAANKKPAKPAKKTLKSDMHDNSAADSRHNWPQVSFDRITNASHMARVAVEDSLRKCFSKSKAIIGMNGLAARPAAVGKADDGDNADDEFMDSFWPQVEQEFNVIPTEIAPNLEKAAKSGLQSSILSLGVDDIDYISLANTEAQTWATNRAAEMVGKKWVDGMLVDNPDAQWSITQTTRDDIRKIIADGFADKSDMGDIVSKINDQVFDDARAKMIARTEIGRAQMGAQVDTWKKTGLVKSLVWEAIGEDPCDECDMNDGEEVEFGKAFPSGAYSTMDSHPNCSCIVYARKLDD